MQGFRSRKINPGSRKIYSGSGIPFRSAFRKVPDPVLFVHTFLKLKKIYNLLQKYEFTLSFVCVMFCSIKERNSPSRIWIQIFADVNLGSSTWGTGPSAFGGRRAPLALSSPSCTHQCPQSAGGGNFTIYADLEKKLMAGGNTPPLRPY